MKRLIEQRCWKFTGVHIAKHEHSYPVGYVDMLKMNPMNFEEFCLSQRKGKLFDICKDSFLTKSKCPVHEDLLRLYYEYLIVGGMPEAVKDFIENENYNQVKKIHRYIGTAYTADMAKYSQTADSIKIIACYDSLPNQLAKENNNTKFIWKHTKRLLNFRNLKIFIDLWKLTIQNNKICYNFCNGTY